MLSRHTAEDSQSGERLPTPSTGLQFACATFTYDRLAPRASLNVARPMELSLDELCRYTNKTKAAPQFHSGYETSVP